MNSVTYLQSSCELVILGKTNLWIRTCQVSPSGVSQQSETMVGLFQAIERSAHRSYWASSEAISNRQDVTYESLEFINVNGMIDVNCLNRLVVFIILDF